MKNLLRFLLPFKSALKVNTIELNEAANRFEVELYSRSRQTRCPGCNRRSRRVHSYYTRTITDLPWADFAVCLRLQVRKFRCLRQDCEQQVFCERLPAEMVSVWARKTDRLLAQQRHIGLALGSKPGARLSQRLHRPTSATSLLRLIRATASPAAPTPRVLGVDDFAKRKGQRYGTVLVDLERQAPIELLADREASTLAAWLKAHPGVEIIARDRAGAYADGARQGAPQALQVADRFHLIRNLADALLQVFENASLAPGENPTTAMKPETPSPLIDLAVAAGDDQTDEAGTPAAVILPKPTSPPRVQAHQAQQRADYAQAKQLQTQSWTIAAIARQLKLNRKTVRRYLRSDTFPEKRRPPSQVDPYKPYILQRWNAGCRTGTELLKEIQQQGYRGTASVVFDYITRLRQAQGLPPRSRAFAPDQQQPISDPVTEVLTPREAVWLVIGRAENSSDDDKARLEKLIQTNTTIAKAVDLTRDFLQPLRQRQPEQFDGWLEQAAHSDLAPFHNFVKSLRRDYEAVKAAFALCWSTGPVEGQINRLKMIKRQMYGRAKLDLLEKRFLLVA